MDMRLFDALTAYSASGMLPLHMPGHMRGQFDYLPFPLAQLDITEINGFDNLHDAGGILYDAMARAAALWGSETALFSVNGSTGGILAAIHTATRAGDKIIVARNCHKSVWHAIELCRLDPVFLTPPVEESFGIFGSLPPSAVEAALDAHPGAALVVLTSPTYEGVLSDVCGICAAAHRRGVAVLVDEAHGAHLGFGGGFSDGAVRAGADLVVQSLHKTLPSLTQTAILHLQGPRVSPDALRRSMNIFETSSPSYLLLASCDGCCDLLSRKPELFAAWGEMLDRFAEHAAALSHLRLFSASGKAAVFAHDKSKLLFSVRGTALTGPALMDKLRAGYGIELEMVSGDYALAMTGLGSTPSQLERLAGALTEIDSGMEERSTPGVLSQSMLPPPPVLDMLPAEAMDSSRLLLPLERTAGKIAADYLWAYPPGIPILSPGQRVTAEALAAIAALRTHGVPLKREIFVVK